MLKSYWTARVFTLQNWKDNKDLSDLVGKKTLAFSVCANVRCLCGSIHINLLFYFNTSSRPIFVLLFHAQCLKAFSKVEQPSRTIIDHLFVNSNFILNKNWIIKSKNILLSINFTAKTRCWMPSRVDWEYWWVINKYFENSWAGSMANFSELSLPQHHCSVLYEKTAWRYVCGCLCFSVCECQRCNHNC